MAKTVDEVTLKVGVEGGASLDSLNSKLGTLEEQGKKANAALNQIQGGVRNVAYQIQDVAVQLSMGQNPFMVLTQQLPQLLSGFGTAGVVIGAVAAVALPLLQKGLEAAGFDFRNLNQRVNDGTSALKEYQAAQQLNFTTLAGLKDSYGSLALEAQKFFEVQRDLTKQFAAFQIGTQLTELRKEFRDLAPPIETIRKELGVFSAPIEGVARLEQFFARQQLGLSAEQAEKLGQKIRALNSGTPEQLSATIADILQYLKEINPEADNANNRFNKLIEPLLKIQTQLLDFNKNLNAAAEASTKLNAELTGIQNKFAPDIGNARRNYEQFNAIRLEGAMKLAEFNRQMEEKNKDGINRTAEAEAGRRKIQIETNEKIKDFINSQQEAYKASQAQNEAKFRQLGLESDIVRLQDQGRYTLAYEVQYTTDIARNAKEYQDTLVQINESRRKNVITEQAANDLRAKAAIVQQSADAIAEQNRQKRINDARDAQTAVLFEITGRERSIELEKQSLELKDRLRLLYPNQIEFEDKVARLKFDQAEYERKINEEVRLGKITREDANARIARQNELLEKSIGLEQRRSEIADASREFSRGWEKAISDYVKNARDGSKAAEQFFNKAVQGIEDTLVNFTKTGKLEWKSFVLSLAEELLRSQIRQLMASLFSNNMNAGNSGAGFFSKLLGFASGGIIPTNGPVLVGERGPELLLGASGNRVVPNGQLSNSQTVVYNINAVDASSFKSLVARDPAFIHAIASQGARTVPARR